MSKDGNFKPDERNPNPRPMREGDLDRQVVRLVYDYRLLSQTQIEVLANRSKSQMQRLLRRLYDHRYLERVFLPVSYFGAPPTFYILDREGIACLQRQGVTDFTSQPTKAIAGRTIAHTNALNSFRIAVSQAAATHGVEVLTWMTETEMHQDYDRVHVPGSPRPTSLIPDSFFALDVPGKGKAPFFVELDRGTMPLKRFKHKVKSYNVYYKTGAFQQRYQFKGFRVLTVVADAGERRVQNLRDATATVSQIGNRYWFGQIEDVTQADPLYDPCWCLPDKSQRFPLISH